MVREVGGTGALHTFNIIKGVSAINIVSFGLTSVIRWHTSKVIFTEI